MDNPQPQKFEDVRSFSLSEADEATLLTLQDECTLTWITRDGSPMSSIVNFVARDGRFYITTAAQRPRVAAFRRDPRCTIVISAKGTSIGISQTVTYKGTATILDDGPTKAWFYPALARRKFPADPERAKWYAEMLDSPNRVVLEISPTKRVSYDGRKKQSFEDRDS